MPTQQQRSEETRRRILQAAEECFARNSYDATSVNELCERAGVTKGAFYYHFPGKHDVFMALLNRWLESLDEQLAAARSSSGSIPDALNRIGDLAEPVFQVAGDRLPLFLEFWSRAAHDSETWQATIAPYQRYQAYFAGLIKAGIEEGSFTPVDPDLAARVLLGTLTGTILQSLLDPAGAKWGAAIREGIRLFLAALVRSK
jgi:AcrR family transcriptional regulator